MRWFVSRALIYSTPRLLSSSRLIRHSAVSSSFFPRSCLNRLVCKKFFSEQQKVSNRICKAAKRIKEQHAFFETDQHSHIMWWKERMEVCKKPSAVQLIKRLMYSNLLGLDHSLKNGSLKEGTLNMEMLQFKARFPREVLLCRVGDFYEAVGFDACILVEHAGLNPFGGLRSDSIPKAGCPVINLRQTLDDLARCGYSVCIVEEVQGPTNARSRKGRFISGHAHPGSPYVFGLAGVDDDVDFPEPMPVVGISRSAKGYCMISVLETMKTFSEEDGLTEEAVVTKLRTCRCHHLFLHASLKQNSSGTCRWGEFGEGGLLWSECSGKNFEWFDGDPVADIFEKVKDIYGLDREAKFRNVTILSEKSPRPLYLGTATQIGVIPTDGIPSLLKVLLPSNCVGLPAMYMRDLLLNPPPYSVATSIQETCKLMDIVTCSLPEFTCISAPKLVKLLESKEVNHMEFCRIKHVVDEVLLMCNNNDLFPIFQALLDPTWAATGLKIAPEILAKESMFISQKIDEIISLDGEQDQAINSSEYIPRDFFYDMESSWKGRVKSVHAQEAFEDVETAAKELSNAIMEDFAPIISRLKTILSPFGGPKGEITYAREHGAVWFKGKRFVPSVWANTPGEFQIKQLRHATDSKGRKVGEEWFTTVKVEHALARYHESTAKAKAKVLEILRDLSAQLQSSTNILVFSSTLLVIAKALFYHVSEGRRRKWVFPRLVEFSEFEDNLSMNFGCKLELINLSPYWFDAAQSCAIHNTITMQSMFLLTGPNGGGKSSLLRSICAATLLGICGLMVPAESAVIPHFDSVMLHMKSYDSPADGKSSFQIEMSEIRSIITTASSRSLVLLDEICRGTETTKGTCIAGSVIEALDHVGCLGVISTHLHGIFDLPLAIKKTVYKSMGTDICDGCIKPTWKLVDGVCRESLAFETAKKEGVPEHIIRRAAELYCATGMSNASPDKIGVVTEEPHCHSKSESWNSDPKCEAFSEIYSAEKPCSGLLASDTLRMEPAKLLHHEVESVVTIVCQRKFIDLYKKKNIEEIAKVTCSFIGVRELPPPSTTGTSSVYILFRPDKKLYVGQTDDLIGRVCSHRSKEGFHNSSFLYVVVPGKSVASQLETILINQLPQHGFRLANKADGKHRNFGTSSIFDSFNSSVVDSNSVVDGLHSTNH